MLKTVEDLKRWDIIRISERFKAKSAAKAALQYRQASIESSTPTPPSNDRDNNSTTVSSDVEGNSSIVASEQSRTEDHQDSTTALKRLRTEDHLDSTTASKRLRTEENSDDTRVSDRAGTEDNPDGMRASEHAGTEENTDGTRASERTDDQLEMLLQAAAFTGQNADTSETTTANLGLPMEQSDSEMMMMEEFSNTAAFGLGFNNGQATFFDDVDIDKVNAQYSMHFSNGILCTYDIQLPELENIG